MLPSEFWECTFFDIGNYLASQIAKEKRRIEEEKRHIYTTATLTGKMQQINLANAFCGKKKGKKYPTYEEVFEDKHFNNKNETKTYSGEMGKQNRQEFYKKQMEVYKKMGAKFYN